MKITKINYQAVKNLGNYESERLEASAEVEEGEDPIQAVGNLRAWVEERLQMREEVKNLEEEHRDLVAKVALVKARWEKVQQFFQKLGLSLDAIKDDDGIPF